MAGIEIKGLDSGKLLQAIKKDVEKDLKKHPEKVLEGHIGDIIEAYCDKCGKTTIEVLPKGKGRCTKCGQTLKIDLNITYK